MVVVVAVVVVVAAEVTGSNGQLECQDGHSIHANEIGGKHRPLPKRRAAADDDDHGGVANKKDGKCLPAGLHDGRSTHASRNGGKHRPSRSPPNRSAVSVRRSNHHHRTDVSEARSSSNWILTLPARLPLLHQPRSARTKERHRKKTPAREAGKIGCHPQLGKVTSGSGNSATGGKRAAHKVVKNRTKMAMLQVMKKTGPGLQSHTASAASRQSLT